LSGLARAGHLRDLHRKRGFPADDAMQSVYGCKLRLLHIHPSFRIIDSSTDFLFCVSAAESFAHCQRQLHELFVAPINPCILNGAALGFLGAHR
jgi:hypothetical protein